MGASSSKTQKAPVDAHRRLDKALLSLPALPRRSGETLAFIGRCFTDGAAEPQPADAAPDRSDVSMPGSWNSARPAGVVSTPCWCR